jgi:hypothetical protein
MTEAARFQRGDRVVHPRKPEWGEGEVRAVQAVAYQGQPAQRVTVQFANHGRAVINTAVAPLQSKNKNDLTSTQPDQQETEDPTMTTSSGWIESLERSVRGSEHELWQLPSSMTDPFTSLAERLTATVDSYRFSTEARPLIDWAVVQTGLDDPLSRYSRPELEQAFPGFARNRDQHLKALVRKIKQEGQADLLHQVKQQTRVPEGRRALEKAMQS